MIYLDYAATSFQKPESVYSAVLRMLRNGASAGRGGYPASEEAASRIFDCRSELMRLFNMEREEQIVFTYNATMALNIAIKGLMPDNGDAVISGYEHNAVVRPLQALSRRGVRFHTATAPLFDPAAMVEAFRRTLTPGTKLAVCTQVSNVFGYILPIMEIDALCHERGIPLIIDASQGAGAVDLDFSRLRAAQFVCCPGHKGLYGPQGTGVLLCRNADAATVFEGGTGSESASFDQPQFLPDRFESGTHNAAGIAGLCEGVRFVNRIGTERILKHEQALIDAANAHLAHIPGVHTFYAQNPAVQSGVLSFFAEGIPCETLAQMLAEGGIAVRAGLHCAPLAHRTVGTAENGTVRVSTSVFNTEQDIERLALAVRAAVSRHGKY